MRKNHLRNLSLVPAFLAVGLAVASCGDEDVKVPEKTSEATIPACKSGDYVDRYRITCEGDSLKSLIEGGAIATVYLLDKDIICFDSGYKAGISCWPLSQVDQKAQRAFLTAQKTAEEAGYTIFSLPETGQVPGPK